MIGWIAILKIKKSNFYDNDLMKKEFEKEPNLIIDYDLRTLLLPSEMGGLKGIEKLNELTKLIKRKKRYKNYDVKIKNYQEYFNEKCKDVFCHILKRIQSSNN